MTRWLYQSSLTLCLLLTSFREAPAQDSWKTDWVTTNGFRLEIDTEGYDFPSAIAFVPNPGPGPKDPLYFVTELRGKIKVITNDRSIYTFAENFFELVPRKELPDENGEIGMAAITLEPTHGYVFVSFAYQDSHKIYHNSIVRFSSQPVVFGTRAIDSLSFADIFDSDRTSTHHFIGGMAIHHDTLWVSVGDGYQPTTAQNLDTTSGKILRMTLDGKPVHDNPFYQDDDINNTRNFVWAYGVRNCFGLTTVSGRLFAAENGVAIDRFFEVQKGENYKWDGTDWSIGMNVPMVFSPSVSPVQMLWLPMEIPVFPEQFRKKFYVAFAGSRTPTRGITMLSYDFKRSQMANRPEQLLRYVGENDSQMPVGVGLGKDGMYVVPILPVRHEKGAKGAVLRIRYDPTNLTPQNQGGIETPQAIMWRAACVHCHSYDSSVDFLLGPSLDDETLIPRILKRLESDEYRTRLLEIEALDFEPYVSYRKARQEVMGAKGIERARLWIKYRIMNPQFDQTNALMPNLGLNESDADKVADYLVKRYGKNGLSDELKHVIAQFLPRYPNRGQLVISFGVGCLASFIIFGGFFFIRRLRARTSPNSQ